MFKRAVEFVQRRKANSRHELITQTFLAGAAQGAETVRDEWHAMWLQSQEMVEQLTAAVEYQANVIDAARHLMTVLAQRTHNGEPLFLIHDVSDLGDADTIKHAIISLQAMLEGSELPPMAENDRVLH